MKKDEEKKEEEDEGDGELNEASDYLIPKEQLEQIKQSGKQFCLSDDVL